LHAATECRQMFEGLGLPLAEDKAQWIASTLALDEAGRRVLRSSLGDFLHSARRLGIDHSLYTVPTDPGRHGGPTETTPGSEDSSEAYQPVRIGRPQGPHQSDSGGPHTSGPLWGRM
jgi:hypothetical protein